MFSWLWNRFFGFKSSSKGKKVPNRSKADMKTFAPIRAHDGRLVHYTYDDADDFQTNLMHYFAMQHLLEQKNPGPVVGSIDQNNVLTLKDVDGSQTTYRPDEAYQDNFAKQLEAEGMMEPTHQPPDNHSTPDVSHHSDYSGGSDFSDYSGSSDSGGSDFGGSDGGD